MINGIFIWLAVLSAVSARYYYPVVYNNLGCWKDTSSRAIPYVKGGYLDGNDQTRVRAIQKCALMAKIRQWDVFAVQCGGQCFTSPNARNTYSKYGQTTHCKADGEGGTWANQVYEIVKAGKVSLENLGCWKDRSQRAIPTMEKLDKVLDGEYSRRKDAIHKCVEVGYKRGYDIIALQHGGWCAGSRDAEKTYKKYGSSHDCKKDGEGGPWANQVYRINIHDELLERDPARNNIHPNNKQKPEITNENTRNITCQYGQPL